MRERPIIFSGASVNAILRGEKTQTRRIVKPQPVVEPDGRMHWNGIGWTRHHERLTGPNGTMLMKCPFGQTGDRLWVREAWRIVNWNEDGDWGIRYEADGDHHVFEPTADQLTEDQGERYWIECSDDMEAAGFATNEDTFQFEWQRADEPEPETPTRLRPSIFMPRWASRILLEVVSVRVERLQEISEEDARAEGVTPGETTDGDQSYGLGFLDLWDSINAKKPGHAWDDNPWVWVIEFKQVTS